MAHAEAAVDRDHGPGDVGGAVLGGEGQRDAEQGDPDQGDLPKSLETLPPGKPIIAGVAWAQQRGITKVEVRIDEGEWREADLATDAGVDLWRQWSYRFDGEPGLHTAQVRATDATGEVQPEQRTKVFPDGARGWHQIQFTSE